jgi:hypothetical protein
LRNRSSRRTPKWGRLSAVAAVLEPILYFFVFETTRFSRGFKALEAKPREV